MKRMNIILRLTFLLFTVTLAVTSCKKDDDSSSNPSTPSTSTLKTTVAGRITDTEGLVMPGVTVKLGNGTTVTDSRGYFLFTNADVPISRMILTAVKPGYFNCIHAKKTQGVGVNYVNLVMAPQPTAVLISGTTGGVVNIPGGARITFPANAFETADGSPYTGQVQVYSRHINPADDNFEAVVPGGDLSGTNTAGQMQTLYSLGMIEAVLMDNSGVNEIKIADGKSAELRFPIDPSQSASALATVPLWHLNESTGIWQEEGAATKAGNFFTGNVTHFSTWNCDYQGERATIVGKVVDCEGVAMANIIVTIDGFLNITTDNTGMFTTWVPAGYTIECQVLAIYNPFLTIDSNDETIIAIAGQTNIVPVLTIPCVSKLTGTVKSCNGILPSPAFVYFSWNGGNRYYYTTDGTYTIDVPVSSPINVIAHLNNLSDTKTVVSGATETTTNVPALTLCNMQVISNVTGFTLNAFNVSTNYTVVVTNTNASYTDQDADGEFESAAMSLTGFAHPGNWPTIITIGLYEEIDGHYSLLQNSQNNVYIAIDSIGNFGNGNFQTTTLNRLTVTDYGSPGSFLTGMFEFNTAGGSVTNGQFTIAR